MAGFSEYRPGECAETAGFLFSHTCGEFATTQCVLCAKPICHAHSVPDNLGNPVCTTCTKEQARSDPERLPDDNPHFYADAYYGGTWLAIDFTDSDEAVLNGGGEAARDDVFEDDMGAS